MKRPLSLTLLFNFFVNIPCFRILRIVLFYSFALGAAYPRAISLALSHSLQSPLFLGWVPTSRRALVADAISCNVHCRKNQVTRPLPRLLPLIRLVPTSRPFIVTSRSVNVRHGRFRLVLSTTKPVPKRRDPRETSLRRFDLITIFETIQHFNRVRLSSEIKAIDWPCIL